MIHPLIFSFAVEVLAFYHLVTAISHNKSPCFSFCELDQNTHIHTIQTHAKYLINKIITESIVLMRCSKWTFPAKKLGVLEPVKTMFL